MFIKLIKSGGSKAADVLNNHSKNLDDLVTYLDKQDLVSQFVKYAKSKGVSPNWNDIKTSKKIILTNIKAEISRNIFDNEGYYPIFQEIDYTLDKAIEVMSK